MRKDEEVENQKRKLKENINDLKAEIEYKKNLVENYEITLKKL